MNQVRRLTITLFLILTMIVMGGMVRPVNAAESTPKNTQTALRTTILDEEESTVDETDPVTVTPEEVTPPITKSDEEMTTETDDRTEVTEVKTESDLPTAGPIHSDLRNIYTEGSEAADQPQKVDVAEKTDVTAGASANPAKDSPLDPVKSSTDSDPDLESGQKSTEPPTQTDTTTELDSELKEPEDVDQVTDSIETKTNDTIAPEMEEPVLQTDQETASDLDPKDQKPIQIQIQAQNTSPAEQATPTVSDPTSSPEKLTSKTQESRNADSPSHPIATKTTLGTEQDEDATPVKDDTLTSGSSAQNQFAEQAGVLGKVVFIFKSFGLWLNQIVKQFV